MLKLSFLNTIPEHLHKEFKENVIETNWKRFYYFSLVSFLIMILLVLLPDWSSYKKGLFDLYIGYKYFFWIHLAFIFQSILFWFSFYFVKKIKSHPVQFILKDYLVLINIFFVLLFVLLLALISQSIHGAIDSYTIGMIIVAGSLLIPFRIAIFLFGPVHIAFVFGILEFQPEIKLAFSHISNASVMFALSLLFNQVFYISKKNDFLKNKTIEVQNNDLLNLTNELKKINEEQTSNINRTKQLLKEASFLAEIGVWEFDLEMQRGYWSNIAKHIFEVKEDFEPNLESLFHFIKDSTTANKIKSELENTIQSGFVINEEIEIETGNKNSLWIRFIAHCELKNSKCKRLYGMFQNITDKKLAEEELRLLKNRAEKSNSLKSEFIANLSHEIRNPLSSILGFTDLLMYTELDSEQFHFTQTANTSANYLLELVNNILDYSKLEAGMFYLRPEKMNLFDLLEQSVDSIRYKTKEKRIDLIILKEENTPEFIYSDPIRLRQILLNLLSNAVKFTHSGKIELIVNTQGKSILNLTNPSDIVLQFSVKDSGIGISKENQEKIFEAFSQVSSQNQTIYEGTGLGLSITSQLLSLMGSKLELTSELGKGSTFYFSILVKLIP